MAKTIEKSVRDAARNGDWARFEIGESVPAGLIVDLACVPAGDTSVHPKGVRIRGAVISGALDFQDRTLTRPLFLTRCDITERINLRRARSVALGFQNCPRICGVGADGLRCEGSLILGGSKVEGTISLTGARISGNINFNRVEIRSGLNRAIRADRMRLDGTLFLREGFLAEGAVRLAGARIGGSLRIVGATFDGQGGQALVAEGLSVAGGLVLRDSTWRAGHLNLSHAHVGFLDDDSDSWPKTGDGHDLGGFTYDSIHAGSPIDAPSRLEWIRLQPKHSFFDPQPYEQLAKVMRAQGHHSDARKVLIAKERDRRNYQKDFAWAWSHVLESVIGYGYQPWRAAIWACLFVWLGWGLFGNAADLGHMVPSKERVYLDDLYVKKGRLPPEYPHLDPLVYSLDLFLPFVDLQQEDYWMPTDQKGQARFLGRIAIVWRWVHIALGWALSALFVAGITGLIKKE